MATDHSNILPSPRQQTTESWAAVESNYSARGQSQHGGSDSSAYQRGNNGFASNWLDFSQRNSLRATPSNSNMSANHLQPIAYPTYPSPRYSQAARAPDAQMIVEGGNRAVRPSEYPEIDDNGMPLGGFEGTTGGKLGQAE